MDGNEFKRTFMIFSGHLNDWFKTIDTMGYFRFAIATFLAIISMGAGAQTPSDYLTISGRGTDFNNNLIDSCSVMWKNERFENIFQVVTDSDGFYSVPIRKRGTQ